MWPNLLHAILGSDVLLLTLSASAISLGSTIDLLATETVYTPAQPLVEQLHHDSVTLWRSPSLPGSSTPASSTSPHLPSVMPFQLSLPEHLQHCIHLPGVKLEYRLIATLHPHPDEVDREPVTKSVLVHLTRYTPPNPMRELLPASLAQRYSEEPKLWTITYPTRIEARLARTVFRRAERINITVKVPPPDEKLVDKGLRIRSVEAQLIRNITSTGRKDQLLHGSLSTGPLGTGSSSGAGLRKATDKGKGNVRGRDVNTATTSRAASVSDSVTTSDGWEPHGHLLGVEDDHRALDEGSVGPSSLAHSPTATHLPPSPSEPPPPPFEDSEQHTEAPHTGQNIASGEPALSAAQHSSTVLAHSGKSCRFSMQRPLRLNLTLVPPFTAPTLPHPTPDHDAPPAGLSPLSAGTAGGGGGCESVSQVTRLSKVDFSIRIRVRMQGPDEQALNTPSQERSAAASANRGLRSSSQTARDVVLEQDIFILPGVAGRVARSPESDDAETSDSLGDFALQAGEAENPELADLPMEEEFDGYEDFRGQRDAYQDVIDDVPRLGFSAPSLSDANPTSPPSFEATASSQTLDGSAVVNAVVRQQEDGEEPPPNLEQSRHDLQIFPAHDDHSEFPPPPPHHAEADLGPSHDDSPPSWAAYDVQGTLPARLPPVHIEGVGVGEPRLRPPDVARSTQSALDAEDVDPASRIPGAWSADSSADYMPLESRATRSPPPTFEFLEEADAVDPVRRSLDFAGQSSPALDPVRGTNFAVSSPPPPPPLSDASDFSRASGNSDEGMAVAGEPPPYMHPPSPGAQAGLRTRHHLSPSAAPLNGGESSNEEASNAPDYEDEAGQGQVASSSSAQPAASTSTGRGDATAFRSAAEEKATLAAAYSASVGSSDGGDDRRAQTGYTDGADAGLQSASSTATSATGMPIGNSATAAQDGGGPAHHDRGMPPAYAASSSPPSPRRSPPLEASGAHAAPNSLIYDDEAAAAHMQRAAIIDEGHIRRAEDAPMPGAAMAGGSRSAEESDRVASGLGDRDGLPDYEA